MLDADYCTKNHCLTTASPFTLNVFVSWCMMSEILVMLDLAHLHLQVYYNQSLATCCHQYCWTHMFIRTKIDTKNPIGSYLDQVHITLFFTPFSLAQVKGRA